MKKNNSSSSSSKLKIQINSSNSKKTKPQIKPINKNLFRPISKKNIKNINKSSNKENKSPNKNQNEITIKKAILNTASRFEINKNSPSKRVITPIKGRLSYQTINCKTPYKKRFNQIDLSINNILNNVYYNNNIKGYRKFNFEKMRNKTANNSNQNSSHEINYGFKKNNSDINLYGNDQLKIIKSLKNELKMKNEENMKLKNELSLLLKRDNNHIDNNKLNENNNNSLKNNKEQNEINGMNNNLIEQQKKKIYELNSINEGLKKEIDKLKKIIESNTQTYEDNQKSLAHKLIKFEEENQQLKSFEKQFNQLKKENKTLKQKINEKINNEKNNNIKKIIDENQKLKEEIDKLKKENSELKVQKRNNKNEKKQFTKLIKNSHLNEICIEPNKEDYELTLKNKYYENEEENGIEVTEEMKNQAISFVNDTFKSFFDSKKMNI